MIAVISFSDLVYIRTFTINQIAYRILQLIDFRMFKFTQVAHCKYSVAEQIDYDNPTILKNCVKGDLSVYLQVSTGMMFFRMGAFEYGINPNDQIIYEDSDPNFKLVLCLDSNPDYCWILKINDNVQLIYFVLSERCKLIHKRASKIIIKQIENAKMETKQQVNVQANYAKIRGLQPVKSQPYSQNYPNMNMPNYPNYQNNVSSQQGDPTTIALIDASKSLANGMTYIGKIVAKGFESLGAYFSKKVDPAQAIVMSEDSKNMVKKSVDGSKKLLDMTSQKFAVIFRMAKKQVVGISNKLQNGQQGQQAQQGGSYKDYKKKLLTGIHLIANVYEGFSQGISQAGTGLAKGTTQVVQAKYGQDAGQASYNLIEGARNVYRLMQAPKKVAKQQFLPTQSTIRKL